MYLFQRLRSILTIFIPPLTLTPFVVHAQSFPEVNTIVTLPGLPTTDPVTTCNYLLASIAVIIGLMGLLAVVIIVLSGIQYILAANNVGSKTEAKTRITQALMGLVIALGAYAMLNSLNPNLVQGCIPIEPVDNTSQFDKLGALPEATGIYLGIYDKTTDTYSWSIVGASVEECQTLVEDYNANPDYDVLTDCINQEFNDTEAPIISTPTDTIEIMEGDEFTYLHALDGVTVDDNVDGNLTRDLMLETSIPIRLTPGEYDLIYRSIDKAGNEGTATVKLIVKEEDRPPEFRSTGADFLTFDVGEVLEFEDLIVGLSGLDLEDPDIMDSLVMLTPPIDTSIPGTYEVVFELTDSEGQTAQHTRVVTIRDPDSPFDPPQCSSIAYTEWNPPVPEEGWASCEDSALPGSYQFQALGQGLEAAAVPVPSFCNNPTYTPQIRTSVNGKGKCGFQDDSALSFVLPIQDTTQGTFRATPSTGPDGAVSADHVSVVISECPGDFTKHVVAGCSRSGDTASINFQSETQAELGCSLAPDRIYFANVQAHAQALGGTACAAGDACGVIVEAGFAGDPIPPEPALPTDGSTTLSCSEANATTGNVGGAGAACYPALPNVNVVDWGAHPGYEGGRNDPRCTERSYPWRSIYSCTHSFRWLPNQVLSIPFTANKKGSSIVIPLIGEGVGGFAYPSSHADTEYFDSPAIYISRQPGTVDPDDPYNTGALPNCYRELPSIAYERTIRLEAHIDGAEPVFTGLPWCQLEAGSYYYNIMKADGIRDAIAGNPMQKCGCVPAGDCMNYCAILAGGYGDSGITTLQHTSDHEDQKACIGNTDSGSGPEPVTDPDAPSYCPPVEFMEVRPQLDGGMNERFAEDSVLSFKLFSGFEGSTGNIDTFPIDVNTEAANAPRIAISQCPGDFTDYLVESGGDCLHNTFSGDQTWTSSGVPTDDCTLPPLSRVYVNVEADCPAGSCGMGVNMGAEYVEQVGGAPDACEEVECFTLIDQTLADFSDAEVIVGGRHTGNGWQTSGSNDRMYWATNDEGMKEGIFEVYVRNVFPPTQNKEPGKRTNLIGIYSEQDDEVHLGNYSGSIEVFDYPQFKVHVNTGIDSAYEREVEPFAAGEFYTFDRTNNYHLAIEWGQGMMRFKIDGIEAHAVPIPPDFEVKYFNIGGDESMGAGQTSIGPIYSNVRLVGSLDGLAPTGTQLPPDPAECTWCVGATIIDGSGVAYPQGFTFGGDTPVAIEFNSSDFGSGGYFDIGPGAMGAIDTDAWKTASISVFPGDFDTNILDGACIAQGVSIKQAVSVDGAGAATACQLEPDTIYYLNIGAINPVTGVSTCGAGTCGAMVNERFGFVDTTVCNDPEKIPHETGWPGASGDVIRYAYDEAEALAFQFDPASDQTGSISVSPGWGPEDPGFGPSGSLAADIYNISISECGGEYTTPPGCAVSGASPSLSFSTLPDTSGSCDLDPARSYFMNVASFNASGDPMCTASPGKCGAVIEFDF